MSASQVTQLALSLTPEERADLAQTLWESLDTGFLAELEARDQSISRGEVTCSTHEEVMAKARRSLGC